MRHPFKLIGSAVCLSASAMLASCCCGDGGACDAYNKPVNTYAPGREQPSSRCSRTARRSSRRTTPSSRTPA